MPIVIDNTPMDLLAGLSLETARYRQGREQQSMDQQVQESLFRQWLAQQQMDMQRQQMAQQSGQFQQQHGLRRDEAAQRASEQAARQAANQRVLQWLMQRGGGSPQANGAAGGPFGPAVPPVTAGAGPFGAGPGAPPGADPRMVVFDPDGVPMRVPGGSRGAPPNGLGPAIPFGGGPGAPMGQPVPSGAYSAQGGVVDAFGSPVPPDVLDAIGQSDPSIQQYVLRLQEQQAQAAQRAQEAEAARRWMEAQGLPSAPRGVDQATLRAVAERQRHKALLDAATEMFPEADPAVLSALPPDALDSLITARLKPQPEARGATYTGGQIKIDDVSLPRGMGKELPWDPANPIVRQFEQEAERGLDEPGSRLGRAVGLTPRLKPAERKRMVTQAAQDLATRAGWVVSQPAAGATAGPAASPASGAGPTSVADIRDAATQMLLAGEPREKVLEWIKAQTRPPAKP